MSFAISTVFTEGRHPGEYIKSEARGSRSRDNAILAQVAGSCAAGTVLGAILFGAATVTPTAGNTGNGAVSAVALGAKTKVGAYTVEFTGPTTFDVVSPTGTQLAPGLKAGAYSDPEIGFAFAAGATPMAAGDTITIVVAAGSEKLVPCVATATDGSQNAAAILYANVDATSGDQPVAVTSRDTEVFGLRLTWDASISGNPTALAAATAQLAAKGIILR